MINDETPKTADRPYWDNLISQPASQKYKPFANDLKELAEITEKALAILEGCFDTGKGWPDEKNTKMRILYSAINLKQKLEFVAGPESAAAFYRDLELVLFAVTARANWDTSELHIGVDSRYGLSYEPGIEKYTNKEIRQMGAMQEMERLIVILKEWHERPNANSYPVGKKAKSQKAKEKPHYTHSEDYTSVVWCGKSYQFTKTQALCVKRLWAEWEKSEGLSLSEKTIGEKIGSSADNYKLKHTFRVKRNNKSCQHPAWGKMIVSCGKGMFCLKSSRKK